MSLLQLFICIGIAYMAFCRLTRTDRTTRLSVRWAFSALGASACGIAISPWAWGLPATLPAVLFELSIASMMMAMAPIWRHGVPPQIRGL
jgi:hypothetical protein